MSSTRPLDLAGIDAIIFDLDGTLIDTDNADVATWTRRLARFRGNHAKGDARALVMALETPVNLAFTVLDWLGLDSLLMRLFINANSGDDTASLPPAPGALEAVPRLAARYPLGIASTREVPEGKRFLEANGLLAYFSALSGRDTVWRIKPHPEPVEETARQLGVSPGRCLMVGDTTVDITAGRRAGAFTCGVLCGYGREKELRRAGADVILPDAGSLAALLLRGA